MFNGKAGLVLQGIVVAFPMWCIFGYYQATQQTVSACKSDVSWMLFVMFSTTMSHARNVGQPLPSAEKRKARAPSPT